MTNPITGLPKGHAPRFAPPADRSALFGSHTQEARELLQQASNADWAGDYAKADSLRSKADYRRSELALNGDWAPTF